MVYLRRINKESELGLQFDHWTSNYFKYCTAGVHIIPFSIPFGIDKFERNGGKFFLNDNFKKMWAFLFNWGHFF